MTARPPGTQAKCILLVEDDPAHARLMKRAMRDSLLGNAVHVATDGEQALHYLRQTGPYAAPAEAPRPDLVLLDLQLPGITGIDVLRAIRADAELGGMPVVVLTSSGDPEDVSDAYREHANSYVSKPLDYDRFRSVVRELDFYWSRVNRSPEPH